MPPDRSLRQAPSLGPLELSAVLLLFLLALLVRLRDLDGPFDRGFDGFQGSFFALGAINYERTSFQHALGYPVVNLEDPRGDPQHWYLYANHPQSVPLIAWLSLKAFGPEEWNGAWHAARAPVGIEGCLRAPFFALHALGLLLLWWALRQSATREGALLALALCAMLPLSALYAGLVNYENPSLTLMLAASAAAWRWLVTRRRAALVACGLAFCAAGAVTYAPLFFVPPLALLAWRRFGLQSALLLGATAAAAVLAPLALHAWMAERALEAVGQTSASLSDRARLLWEPLLADPAQLGAWLQLNASRCVRSFSLPISCAALVGLCIALWDLVRTRRASSLADLGLTWTLGGLATLLFFFRHTFEPASADGQTPFLLNLVPGVVALAALPIERAAPWLARLRAGIAPLVIAALLLGLPALLRFESLRDAWRAAGPRDEPAGERGPEQELPRTVGAQLHELLPAHSVGLYPAALGYTPAVSFYAWRSLAPVELETYAQVEALLNSKGLAEAPRYLVLPRQAPSSATLAVEALRARISSLAEPELETERWQAWRL